MEDRQADLQEALSSDDTCRILELTSKLRCRTIGGVERWRVATTSRYIFPGVIGEASHPGLRHKRRREVPGSEYERGRDDVGGFL